MITNFFIPELNNHDVQELWFQQDGATCHSAHATIDLLKDTFGDRLISRFGPVNWPPRSCDLTPLDYFLQLNDFERGRIVEMCRSSPVSTDTAVQMCWQQWLLRRTYQRNEGSGRPRCTNAKQDRMVPRQARDAPTVLLSTIQHTTLVCKN
ncbi:uncharacterized protein TNCV_3241611 [Trichonephila clavipes]|nr:uncharacterized protein TNCV_3241611 [Trichonephila clavipes]